MTEQDRIKWDARYKKSPGDLTPASIVKAYWYLASLGDALDIACGNGRNSRFLADQGFHVDAVDISTVATRQLADTHPKIHVVCQDLDTFTIPPTRYDLIIDIRFLDRRLFPMTIEGLKPGGVLILEAFVGPADHPFCVQENELLHVFQQLRIVRYEEKKTDHSEKFDQIASLVALKP